VSKEANNHIYLPGSAVQKCERKIKKVLPLIGWLQNYTLAIAIADLIAGISVGLVLIPQGIAYAIVADLPPQIGLYSSIMGTFTYILLGTSPEINNAPASITALLSGVHSLGNPMVATMQAFFSGLIILGAGVFRLGFLLDFISVPVIAGFVSAASIQIASMQLTKLLGQDLSRVDRSELGLGILDTWVDVSSNLGLVTWTDAVLGGFCLVYLLSFRALGRTNWFKPSATPEPGFQTFFNGLGETKLKVVNKFVWFICMARNAILLLFCIIIVFIVEPLGHECQSSEAGCVFAITGNIQTGLPPLQFPEFFWSGTSSPETNITNSTTMLAPLLIKREATEGVQLPSDLPFLSLLSENIAGILLISLISVLQSIAIVKSFAGTKDADTNQEMFALGIGNLSGAFLGQSFPISASFSRSAVFAASGVKTPIANFYGGMVVLLCLAVLMPACALIPKATLGAIVFAGVIFTVDYQIIQPLWRSKRIDMIPGFATFFVCLLYKLEIGIMAGVAFQIALVLYNTARPKLTIEVKEVPGTDSQYLHISPESGILFPAASHVRYLINKAVTKKESPLPVVLDCSCLSTVDFTGAKGLSKVVLDLEAKGREVLWINIDREVEDTLKAVIGDKKFKTIESLHKISV